ncbi:MAG TPA: hypothetical protein VNT76_10920 [Candidatus Binatus sp.]|nr:hypothetical protein [Candidatus Binatus sp.]
MWRFSYVNLSAVLFLIAVFTLQHANSAHHSSALNPSTSLQGADPSSSGSGVKPVITGAAAFLDDAFQRGRIFTDWMMEYNTTKWQRSQASSQGESDLVEARFHVANAEVFREAMRQSQKATRELTQADDLLRAAEPLLSHDLAATLTTVRQRIENAQARNQQDPTSHMTRFESIKEDLDQLIESFHSANT